MRTVMLGSWVDKWGHQVQCDIILDFFAGRMIARKCGITNPEDYGLYLLVDGYGNCFTFNHSTLHSVSFTFQRHAYSRPNAPNS